MSPGKIAWPLILMVVLTLPLWIEAVLLEIRCRSTGLVVNKKFPSTSDGVFWQTHFVDPHAYSSGIDLGSGPLRQAFARGALRALVEGRIAYLEIPYEPVIDPQKILNQKIFVASRARQGSQCLPEDIGNAWNHLPPDLCIAWETAEGLKTRFKVVDLLGEGKNATTVGIVDRQTGEEIARHTHVTTTRASETLLLIHGFHSMQPCSCTDAMKAIDAGTALISLVFKNPNDQEVLPDQLNNYLKAAWQVVRPVYNEEEIPEGRAGIDYWIKRGAVRQLTSKDLQIWRSANLGLPGAEIWDVVPDNVFFVIGEITLPAGLNGGHSVTWVLPKGSNVPPGPRSHSTFLEVGKGCVWGAGSPCR